MPPLWLIIGTVLIVGLSSVLDRVILKPRGETVVVEGKSVSVRRKRDVQLLTAAMVATGMIMFILGVTLIEEGDLLIALLSALPPAAIMVWSLWRGLREDGGIPSEKEVRAARDTGRVLNRHIWQAFAVIATQFALAALQGATDGVLRWILIALDLALFPVWLWLLWRFLRELRRMRADASSG